MSTRKKSPESDFVFLIFSPVVLLECLLHSLKQFVGNKRFVIAAIRFSDPLEKPDVESALEYLVDTGWLSIPVSVAAGPGSFLTPAGTLGSLAPDLTRTGARSTRRNPDPSPPYAPVFSRSVDQPFCRERGRDPYRFPKSTSTFCTPVLTNTIFVPDTV